MSSNQILPVPNHDNSQKDPLNLLPHLQNMNTVAMTTTAELITLWRGLNDKIMSDTENVLKHELIISIITRITVIKIDGKYESNH